MLLSTLFGLFPFLQSCLPIALIRGRSSMPVLRRSFRISKQRPSNVQIKPKGLLFAQNAEFGLRRRCRSTT
jgi:hypothetical protein